MTENDGVDKAAESFKEHGFTAMVYFPPEADWEQVQRFFDRITTLAYDGYFPHREGWDPFIAGHMRDIMGCSRRGDHVYLSTGCLHDNHGYCQGKDGFVGPKKPGVCKFCEAPCACPCHAVKVKESLTGR